jgi:hypothetical protein
MRSRTRSIVRWGVRIALALVALLVLAVVAVAIVLRTRAGGEWLRGQLVTVLDNSFVGGAHLGRVDANVFGDIVIRDLVIDGADGKPAISARTVRVKLAVLPLLVHRVHVESIEADDVALDGRRTPGGASRLVDLTRPKQTNKPSPWRIALDDVAIHRARIALELFGDDVHVDDCELRVRLDSDPRRGIAIAATGHGRWRERGAPIAIAGSIDIAAERVAVPSLSAAIGGIGVVGLAIEVPRGAALAVKGSLGAVAPAQELARLFGVRVPADVAVAIAAMPVGDATALGLDGRLGAAPFRGFVIADPRARRARGAVAADAIAIAGDRFGGVAAIDVAFARGELPRGRAAIVGWAERAGLPRIGVIGAAESAGERATAVIAAASSRGGATVYADVRRRADRSLRVERAVVRARVADPPGGVVRGRLAADLAIAGELSPRPNLAVAGTVEGDQLRARGYAMRSLRVQIDAAQLPARPRGTARVELAGLAGPHVELERVVLDAGDRLDGKLDVSLRAVGDAARSRVEIDAVIALGAEIVIDVPRHFVQLRDAAPWVGRGGRIEIDRERVAIRGLRSAGRNGHLAIDASYAHAGRDAGDLATKLDVELALGTEVRRYGSTVVPWYQGTFRAAVDVVRRRGDWHGRIDAGAQHVGSAKAKDLIDGELAIVASSRTIRAAASARVAAGPRGAGLHAGSADVTVDLDMPAEPMRPASWRALRRDAIRRAELTLKKLSIAQVTDALNTSASIVGVIDGSLAVSPIEISGSLRGRGLAFARSAELGLVDAELKLASPDLARVDVDLGGTLAGSASFHARAELAPPDRLADVAAWRRRGAAVLRGAEARVTGLEITPELVERIGARGDVRGRADATLTIDAGARAARLSIDLARLRGAGLAAPIAARVDAQLEATDATLRLVARARGTELVDARVVVGTTAARVLRDRRALRAAPLNGTIRLRTTPLAALAAIVGNSRATAGTLDGTIAIAGTLGRPTATADIVARDLAVAREPGHVVPAIERLELVARWDGAGGRAALVARARDGGDLRADLRANLKTLHDSDATVVAHRFALAPLAAFVPGVAGGAGGTLDADLHVHGIDPRTLAVTGRATIADARVPIAPQIGTLMHGRVTLVARDRVLTIAVGGALGNGKIALDATAPLPGATTPGRAKLVLDKVQLVGATEPIVTAQIESDVMHDGTAWHARVRVARGDVEIPNTKSERLEPVGAPRDVLYGDPARVHARLARVRANAERRVAGPAVLVADIDLGRTNVVADEFRGVVGGKLVVSVGPGGATAHGTISVRRGVVTLFDRRHTIDRAELTYDGTLDPIVAVHLTYDFPDVTLVSEVHGRLSKPQLALSSAPGNHSQEELLGWLLGGQPGGDPRNAPSASERVSSAAGSLIASGLGNYIKRALPFDLDVLRYEAATSTSSAALTVGTWVTHSLFAAYKNRLSPLPAENASEAAIEYWIRTRFVVQGTVGDRGYDGVDLLWRRRW